jgi:hypothetical protein
MDCIYNSGKCATCGNEMGSEKVRRNCLRFGDPIDSVSSVQPGAVPPAPPPDLTRTDAPSFLEKIRNFASAAVSHVAAGMPMCDDAEIIRRHDICLTCEHLKDNACQLCGCPVARSAGYVSKLSWADQECPAGKWGRATA